MGLHLLIGNKNYSSWSLRPWLAMKVAGKEEWLAKAGRIARERVETAEEAGHRPMF